MPPFGQIPQLTQIGWRLGDVLSGLRQTRVLPVIPQAQVQDILHEAHPFMPQQEWVRVQGLLNRGRTQEAFQAITRFEPEIRQGYEYYLGEMALRSAGMSFDQAMQRPWLSLQPDPEMRAAFEPFRSLADQKLNLDEVERQGTTINIARDDSAQQPVRTEVAAYKKYANHDGDKKGGTLWKEQLGKRMEAEGLTPFKDYWKFMGYWQFGGALASKHVEGRIYLSLRKDFALEIWKYLTGTLNAAIKTVGTAIQFKMSLEEEGFDRFDTAVIYFQAKDERLLHSLLVKMHRAHPEFFKGGRPAFTMPLSDPEGHLMDGLSFGQDPGPYVSFGEARANLVTQAIRIARLLDRAGVTIDWGEMTRMFLYFFDKAKIDVTNPALEKNGRQLFPFLASQPLKPLPPKVPLPPVAVAAVPVLAARMVTSEEQIAREIRERYGYFELEVAQALLKALARRIQRAQEQDDQRQRKRRQPQTSEEFLEEEMNRFLKDFEAASPVSELENRKRIIKTIRQSDRGTRDIRAVAAEIVTYLPALQAPFLSGVLAESSRGSWKRWKEAGSPEGQLLGYIKETMRFLLKEWEKINPPRAQLSQVMADLRRFLVS